jgi:hypothetical protein
MFLRRTIMPQVHRYVCNNEKCPRFHESQDRDLTPTEHLIKFHSAINCLSCGHEVVYQPEAQPA